MKFKILKYQTIEVETVLFNDEVCDYSIGWLGLELDGKLKNLCVEMTEYKDSGGIDLEFGLSKEWFIESKYVDEWIEQKSELHNNLFKFLESWEEKLKLNWHDVYDWDHSLIDYEFEI